MKKYFSLIKASMSEGMNIFKINTNKKSHFSKVILPIILIMCLMGAMYSYSEMIITKLQVVNMEFVILTLFIAFTSILTLIEGIYKSGNLLFNCKDDNLLLSLPIKRSTVLFVRIFKFYLFELVYNSLFIMPAIFVYAKYMNPNITYYFVSVIGLLLFPVFPILISCLLGTILTFISSKFKEKNKIQTILTMLLLLGIMYISFNIEKIIIDIANNASNINEFISKIYYPAGAYIELVFNFNILKLLEFIGINVGLFSIAVVLIGNVYFKINSRTKSIKTNKYNKSYVIKTSSPIKSLIKKEFNRFINSPVFITNAGFGLVLYILGCILLTIRFENISNMIIEINPNLTLNDIKNYISIILFGFIIFSSFMTSITSSMISLEGKSINILKSLPVKPYTIIKAKIYTAVLIMIPCILIGDLIIFLKFQFNLISILLILIATVLFPLLSEIIGIIVNLKYPRMDAKNDTEVVKQSLSSTISVFIGMGLMGITLYALFKMFSFNIQINTIMLSFILIYLMILLLLIVFLHKICDKCFDNISV